MAIRLLTCTSPGVVILSQDSDKVVGRRRSRLMMCAKNSVSKIRSFHLIKNKVINSCLYILLIFVVLFIFILMCVWQVFEDRSAGIVCYKDENGDITCEGYDEGPRFHQKISTFSRYVGLSLITPHHMFNFLFYFSLDIIRDWNRVWIICLIYSFHTNICQNYKTSLQICLNY